LVLQALRSPRGRYEAERASQLSGIPKSTIYDWRRAGVFAPDFAGANPMAWSYRDLIYLRLLAWLRGRGMDRPYASDLVLAIRQEIQSGDRVDKIRTDGRIILRDQEAISRYSGENVFPLDEVLAMFSEFDLLEPIKELGDRPLWGPNLVNPSAFTFISPWVMAGEPCVNESRIATSSLYALHTERGLSAESVVRLYPSLDSEAVSDAWNLERRLRRAA
jgi:uncharacterized protein (DUF433 family)